MTDRIKKQRNKLYYSFESDRINIKNRMGL